MKRTDSTKKRNFAKTTDQVRRVGYSELIGRIGLVIPALVVACIFFTGITRGKSAHAFGIAEGFMKQGDYLLATGDTPGAATCYAKAVKLLPPATPTAQKALKTLEALTSKTTTTAVIEAAVTNSAADAALSGLDKRIVKLDDESLGLIPEEVRIEFLDYFNRGVESYAKCDFASAISLFDSIRTISSHPGSQARINYLLAVCLKKSGKPAEAIDNYIAAVLSDRMIDFIADNDFNIILKKEVADLNDRREKGEETVETGNRRYFLRAFSAYAAKKDEFAAKEAAEVKVGSLTGILKGNFVKLLANLKQAEDRDRAKMAASPLLASIEKKADDLFRRGRFDEAGKQYEAISTKMPDDKMLLKKLEVTKNIVAEIKDGKIPDKAGDFSILADTELNSLNFAAMTEARELFKKLTEAVGKNRYSDAVEAIDWLNALSLPPIAKSKVKYHEALSLIRLGKPSEAGMAYVEALLLNRSVLGVDDHGILNMAIENSAREGEKEIDRDRNLLLAAQAVVNTDFNKARALCGDLVSKAFASQDHRTLLLAQWLANIIDKELGLDRRIVVASAFSSAGAGKSGAGIRGSSRVRGGGRPVVTQQPQGPLMRGGKVIKEIYRHKLNENGEPGDMNGDGIIGPDDVQLISEVVRGKYRGLPEVVKAADITGDGTVDQADFEYAVWSVNGFPGDSNGDKKITRDELDGMYQLCNKLRDVNLDDLFEHERIELQKEIDKYDANKDGKLDFIDHRIMTQTFARIFSR